MSIAQFDTLPPDQQDMIVRLPFRVGMWVSQADKSGGKEAHQAERQALHTIVVAYAEDYLKSEFVQRLMERTVARKGEWLSWINYIDDVPAECERAIKALSEVMPTKEVEILKHNLLEIGFTVAMAFTEEERAPGTAMLEQVLEFMTKIMGGTAATRNKSISPAEYKALAELTNALSLDIDVRSVM